MRPQLNPALRLVWRDASTVQIGLDPDRAVVIGGLDESSAAFLSLLDGTRTLEQLRAHAGTSDPDFARMETLLGLLDAGGALLDASLGPPDNGRRSRTERERQAPDVASALLVHGQETGVRALERRQRATVVVDGAGRIGGTLALILGAAGVGRVVPHDTAVMSPGDLPAVLSSDSVGDSRGEVVRAALSAVVPSVRTCPARAPRTTTIQQTRTLPRPRGRGAARAGAVADPSPPSVWLGGVDVVVLTGGVVQPEQSDALIRADVAHLAVRVRETTAIVGPFVVPGRTSCLRCQDLHRSDRDKAWPRVAAQLAALRSVPAPEPPACDSALATAAAAHAALQVLSYLDLGGTRLPASSAATLEITLPDGVVRRRSWPAHPACGCTWPRAG